MRLDLTKKHVKALWRNCILYKWNSEKVKWIESLSIVEMLLYSPRSQFLYQFSRLVTRFHQTSKIHIKGQTRITKTNLKKQKRKFSPIVSKPLAFIMIKITALVQGKDHHKQIKQIKKSEM